MKINNPFSVVSPEALSPKDIANLFVDVFTDFPRVQDIGHTFIHGARGSGKSMLLRYLEPAVQIEAKQVENILGLKYLAIHVPIKKESLNVTELARLDRTPSLFFSEHMMLMHICNRVFNALASISDDKNDTVELRDIYEKTFCFLLKLSGGTPEEIGQPIDDYSVKQLFELMGSICITEFHKATQYLKRLSLTNDSVPYSGALCGYLDFFIPIVEKLHSLKFLPNAPIFLMVDDADNLSLEMQEVLNSWVSCRTTDYLCLKVTTQRGYKTYRTPDGKIVESPHDYHDVYIDTVYTSKNRQHHYYNRIEEIVKKRLKLAGIHSSPTQFFPVNEKQGSQINAIKRELIEKHNKGEGKGYRSSDDSTRYARPEYMRRLAGKSKSSFTYSYAGFRSLVDLSSGTIRHFLEPVANMFSTFVSQTKPSTVSDVTDIPVAIQDKEIMDWSKSFLLEEFDKIKASEKSSSNSIKLFNLLQAIGGVFRERLLDKDASERRYISIMVSGAMSDELAEIFQLGVQWGYLQKSTIGAKEKVGRRDQYVLSRRLAPVFKLDPSGYAAYLSVTSSALELACSNPVKFIKQKSTMNDSDASQQLSLGEV